MLRLITSTGWKWRPDVDHQAAPGKTWLVVNGDEREVVAIRIAGNQLQQGFHAAHRSHHRVGGQGCVIASDFERVRFILAELGILLSSRP